MSILIFFGVLFILILVHEWGHFIVAKKTGMRVDEFGIGFPPKLFGIRWGETEYTFNVFPIGGFVRIYGEDPTAVGDVDRTRAFGARPKWAQALVLIAGVTMNVLFAWLLFVLIFLGGMPTAVDEAVATENALLVVETVLPDSPAADFLSPGAIIESIQSADITLSTPTISSFSEFVQSRGGEEIAITYRLAGETVTATTVPQTKVLADAPDRAAVGVSLMMVDNYRYSLSEAVRRATVLTYNMTTMITLGLGSLLVDTFQGEADFSQVAGPIGIVGLVGDAAATGFISLLTFTAFISLNLAVINMLPFPALDGGRLVFVAIETVTRRPIAPEWTMRLNLIGFGLLIALMVLVTINDVINLLS